MASWVNVSQMLGARGITQRNVPMRSKLLISTAALLAGIAVASAQNMPGGAQSGGAAQDKSGDKSGQAQPGSQPSTQGQRGQRGPMDQTTGKGPQEQKDQNAQGTERVAYVICPKDRQPRIAQDHQILRPQRRSGMTGYYSLRQA